MQPWAASHACRWLASGPSALTRTTRNALWLNVMRSTGSQVNPRNRCTDATAHKRARLPSRPRATSNGIRSQLNVRPSLISGVTRCKSTATSQELVEDRCEAEYLESLMHRAGELSLRFTTIDSEGNVITEQGTLKKSDLCRQHDLDPRDIRKLDSIQPNLIPTILSRKSSILVNMLHVRALIKADSVILFDPAGSSDSKLKSRLLTHLQANLKALHKLKEMEAKQRLTEWQEGEHIKTEDVVGSIHAATPTELQGQRRSTGETVLGLSYEHRALESVLVSVANALEEELKYTRSIVGDLLSDLENDIDRENLKRLLHYSRRLAGFRGRTRYVLHSIEEVLESDEDLSSMYLTAKKEHRARGLQDHEELELLLESFSKQVEEIVSEVEAITVNMQSTQEIAELMLDANRNTLLGLDLKVSIATLGVGIGALTAGVFGMNLTSHFEQDAWAFYIVTGTAVAASILVSSIGLRRLRQLRRVGLNTSARSNPISKPSIMQRFRALLWKRATDKARVNPVWINQRADEARLKDAMRAKMLEEHRQELTRLEHGTLEGKRIGSISKWRGFSPPESVGTGFAYGRR